MNAADYPAAHMAADSASLAAQRRHFGILGAQLGASLLAAALIGASGTSPVRFKGALSFSGAGLLVVSIGLQLVARVLQHDRAWFDCRAIAESVKTATWRFMMGAVPFPPADAPGSEVAFAEDVLASQQARPAFAGLLARHRDSQRQEITNTMRAMRQSPLENRRDYYLRHRVADQRRWYDSKARECERRKDILFLAILLLHLSAIVIAFSAWRPWNLNVVALIVAASASITAWAQAKRYDELAQAYGLAAQELTALDTRLRTAPDEVAFLASVAETEEAISREHTMWRVRRNRA